MGSQDNQIWQIWIKRLKQWGMHEFAASILEAAGPINLVGAQLVYVSQPLLDGIFPTDHLSALAGLLEEPDQTKAFVRILRGGDE
ncbi:MAG: hypothetical protein AMK69_23970 [Nitrospira bacterium SG8_3]|nr:MAG: hypothetical protein AMK69_23970 [Nitrospira bacterium SG8_3]